MQMLVDGEWIDATDGCVDEIRDRATGKLIETAPHGGALHVARAIEAAQRGWCAMAARTHDLKGVMQILQMLDVGTVVTNHSTAIRLENLPFGGTKMRGNAREGLDETLLDVTEQKTLLMSVAFPA
jgi:acyl-CoA reductase-like NAD-dependent aldehyde dehydrogenase